MKLVAAPYWQSGRGGRTLLLIITEILRDVVAGVILYYVCKWLDENED